MKKYNYKKIYGVLILGVFFTTTWAQRIEESKRITKVMAVDPSARVEVTNKYGDMHIHTWNEDSVKIIIDYTISAKDQKRFAKLKESVDFEFIETTHYVIARTLFLNAGMDMFRDLSSVITSSPSSSINVNYEIYVPENAKLQINNKYGNVYAADMSGDVTFNLAYGVFKSHDFIGHTDITLNNCEATINHINVGLLSLTYSNLLLSSAGNIKLNSNASEVKIYTIDAITVDGKSDQIKIEQCGKANVTGSFSKFEVDNLSGNLNANTKYGNMDIYLSKAHQGDLMINSKYTDIILRVYPNTNKLQSEIRHQRSKLVYPAGIAKLQEEKISANDVIYHSAGTIGNGKTADSKLTLVIESGDLSILSR